MKIQLMMDMLATRRLSNSIPFMEIYIKSECVYVPARKRSPVCDHWLECKVMQHHQVEWSVDWLVCSGVRVGGVASLSSLVTCLIAYKLAGVM